MKRKTRLIAIASVAVVAVTSGGIALAAGTGPSTITACYNKYTGSLRIPTGLLPRCSSIETTLSWNSTGPQGPAGPEGKSAYQVWAALSANAGKTVEEYLESLKGDPGGTGLSAFQVWAAQPGNGTKTVEEFLESLAGERGTDGDAGPSAYDIWLQQGNTGDVDAFLASLRGPAGITGDQGAEGLSAYQVWRQQDGNGEKSVADFFASLKGEPGPKGETGAPGTDGVSPTVTSLPAGNATCPFGGTAITSAEGVTSYACNGAPGQTGAQGEKGEKGDPGSGVVDLSSLNGLACTVDGHAGSLGVTVGTDGAVTLRCTRNPFTIVIQSAQMSPLDATLGRWSSPVSVSVSVTASAAADPTDILVQFGYTAVGVPPSGNGTWTAATYTGGGSQPYVFRRGIGWSYRTTDATYDVWVRVSGDGGATWSYVDTVGLFAGGRESQPGSVTFLKAPPELCFNFEDDNGDGRIDEGCPIP